VSKESKDSKESEEPVASAGNRKKSNRSKNSRKEPAAKEELRFSAIDTGKFDVQEARQHAESTYTLPAESGSGEKKIFEAHLTHEGHYYAHDTIRREDNVKAKPTDSAATSLPVNVVESDEERKRQAELSVEKSLEVPISLVQGNHPPARNKIYIIPTLCFAGLF